jgi:hypothetical protein
MTLFSDEHYHHELNAEYDSSIEKRPHVNINDRVYFQLSVSYSEKLDKIYKKNNRLQYFHLTLENCWLSTSPRDNEDKFQTIITKG